MMNLGRGALLAHQRRMNTHQHNVANASTPGYRRERLELEALGSRTSSSHQGVRAGHLRSIKAPLVDRLVPQKSGQVERSTRLIEAARLVEELGEVDELPSRLSSLFASARGLEVDGHDAIARQEFIDDAAALTEAVRGRHQELTAQRDSGAAQAVESVARLNGLLGELERVEAQVMLAPHVPDLVDARDELARQVGEMTGARVVPDASGRISLVAERGEALFEGGRARQIALEPEGEGFKYTANGRALWLSGELGGMRDADEQVFAGALERLEAFATEFAGAVNTLHAQGRSLNGATNQALFEFDPSAAAATLSVSAAVLSDPNELALAGASDDLPGGAQVAVLIAELEHEPLVGSGQSASRMLLEGEAKLGRLISSEVGRKRAALGALDQLEAMQASLSGVSLEEEMIGLTEAQRAYEASVKLVQTADELMETVLSLV